MQETKLSTQEAALLGDVHFCAATGEFAITHLLPYVKTPAMRDELHAQRVLYGQKIRQSEELLTSAGHETEPLSSLQKAGMKMALAMGGARASEERIAKMMIRGATMGIVDVCHSLNQAEDASDLTRALSRDIVRDMQNSIERLTCYL